ncbi:alkane hydroxylase MAH1-like [Vitis riparia]|uniref:alkane hydroxylase MAH1-like n=1 Tax=Vitis riparia TaxID=96939 RepID=UPI00155AC00C|nr:alkane hydroxylase MAH1-like [Vitis riparia]
MLTTSNPDNVHHVLSTNFSNYPKGPKFRRIFKILGNGLFNSDFDEWRKIRGLAQGFVNHKQFHRFMAKINHDFLENKLVPVLDNASQQNLVVDLQDVFQRLMLDATCITATSYNPNSLCFGFPEVPFLKALDDAGRTQIKVAVNKANKLHIFTEEELNKLVYLHGALYETLRLFPPAPLQVRTCIHPDTLPSGHKVNSKMKIVFSAYAMGRMTSVWGNDCLEFKPQRWITEKGGIKHVPSHKFLAFSACLGKESAITRIKSVAAVILHNYHVQVMEGQLVTPKASIVLHMKNGLRVRIKNTWP